MGLCRGYMKLEGFRVRDLDLGCFRASGFKSTWGCGFQSLGFWLSFLGFWLGIRRVWRPGFRS